jgi:chromosome segregation ATPase
MKNLSVKLEEALQQNINKTKDIDALSLRNKRIEKQLTEAAKAIEKFEEEKSELSDLVTEDKKELFKTDKALKRSNVRKENLDKMVEDIQGKNDEHLGKVEYFFEFEKKPEPAATKTSSTKTQTSSTPSTASQCN